MHELPTLAANSTIFVEYYVGRSARNCKASYKQVLCVCLQLWCCAAVTISELQFQTSNRSRRLICSLVGDCASGSFLSRDTGSVKRIQGVRLWQQQCDSSTHWVVGVPHPFRPIPLLGLGKTEEELYKFTISPLFEQVDLGTSCAGQTATGVLAWSTRG